MSEVKAQQLEQYNLIRQGTKVAILGVKKADIPDKKLPKEMHRAISVSAAAKFRENTYRTLADIDPLTHLSNRRFFNRELEREISLFKRGGREFGLIICDIRKLKKINDSHGHVFGDRVIQGIGKILPDSFRREDATCRLGGDEFAVVLPDIKSHAENSDLTPKDSLAYASLRFLSAVHDLAFPQNNGELHPHLDIGTVVSIPDKDEKQILEIADNASYLAKLINKKDENINRIVIASLKDDKVIYEHASKDSEGIIFYEEIKNADTILNERQININDHV